MAESSELLDSVPDVSIDPEGKMKYILMKITDKQADKSKIIVRGSCYASFHDDIYNKVEPDLNIKGIECSCEGGGRIQHDSIKKTILVYGYSMAYGKPDHSLAVEKLKIMYPGYNDITFSDDGY